MNSGVGPRFLSKMQGKHGEIEVSKVGWNVGWLCPHRLSNKDEKAGNIFQDVAIFMGQNIMR